MDNSTPILTILCLLFKIFAYCAGFFLLGTGGNTFCKIVISWANLPTLQKCKLAANTECALNERAENETLPVKEKKKDGKAGRVIGWLERLAVAGGILIQRWEVLAAVVALKTVARYQELDRQINAEYFLIGSLFSITWAVVITLGLVLFDKHWGFGILQILRSLL